MKLIEDGNFKGCMRTAFFLGGLFSMFVAVKFVPPAPFGGALLLLGFGLAAIGGISSRAHMLYIKPFPENWRKVRKTYELKDDENDEKS
jgi:hypothetical protein